MKRLLKKGFGIVLSLGLIAGSLTAITPTTVKAATVSESNFTSVGGFNETIYAQISGIKDSDVTEVSYSGTTSGRLTGQDFEYLVRDKGDGVRIDIPGITPGTYALTVTTKNGTITKSGITVDAQDRSGYAHFNYTDGVGAYNDDGTLKSNAIVLYVTDDNKNDVTLEYGGVTVKGIGNILNSVGKSCGEKGHETECKKVSGGKTYYAKANTNQGIIEKLAEAGVPLVVRFIGTVSDSGLYERGTFDLKANSGLIDGLTAYDSNDFGGSAKDNGHMARIKSGKDITLEGIGTDAVIDGWGFHYMAESAKPTLGKSFEVRNLTFINTPEDAIGMEGVQVSKSTSSELSASIERCWIHNNEFYCPNISSPAESDKAEGDGSVDFKRGQYFTCSYNYFEGCHKTNLVGSSDDSLQFNLTYHHNYWKLCKARGPLTRNANVHMYNNVFEGQTDYSMNTRANAYIFSEYNMFYMGKNPQSVDSGAIKSFNDSFSSCIGSMDGIVVKDKSETVDNKCQFIARKIDYSKFDTDSSLSYIPTGDYQLQESVTEARKVIYSKTGVLNENPVAASEVTLAQISYLPSNVTPENVTTLPATYTPGKVQKTVYAFTVSGDVDVTVKYSSEALDTTGILVNEAGESFLVGSGTVRKLPAGTYMIQPYNFQPGDGKTMEYGQFKAVTIDSLEISANDPNQHYHNYVLSKTVDATCTVDGSKTYICSGCGDVKVETIKAAHQYSAVWTVDVEPTETTPGSKSHHCLKCDAKTDITVIPAGGSGNDPSVGGDYSYNFTSPDTSNKFYTIANGAMTNSKGSVKYGGLDLTVALKMESKTEVSFTAPSDGKLTLVFGGSTSASGKKVLVNDSEVTCDSNSIAVVDVKAGNVKVTKKDSINLFYIDYAPNSTTQEEKNGLYKEDGEYIYYKDGKVDTSFTGFAKYEDDKVYVKNGKADMTYTGIAMDEDKTWKYVENGKYRNDYTGLAENENGWFYIADGMIDWSYTGLAENTYGWFYVSNGVLDWNYTGLAENAYGWFYVSNGMIDWSYTGLAENTYGWFYISNGMLNWNYTGLAENAYGWFYVSNGMIDWGYTGMAGNDIGWFYINGGILDWSYTGIASNDWGSFYFRGGILDWSYTGTVTDENGTWRVVNGIVVS